jgi:Ca2+-binding RTX toxin-like protein
MQSLRSSAVCQLENLESRRLLAAPAPGITLQSDGTLLIIGTDENDIITVDGVSSDRIVVTDNQPRIVGGRAVPNDLYHQDFDPAAVTRVEVHCAGKNDVVHYNVAVPSEIFGDDGFDALLSDSTAGCTMHGGDGRDVLLGGDGNDMLYGDASPDELFAHGGDDLLSGGGGGDVMHGYRGRDRLYGGPGSDLMYGEEGSDRIFAHAGDDTVFGGQGNDQIDGGVGSDQLHGGSNNDHFVADDSEGDTLFGGTGSNSGTFDDLLDSVNRVDPDA